MPFIVSGTIGERNFNGETVSGKELAKLLGVDFTGERLVTFKMTGQFKKFDHLNQMERNSPGFLLNPNIHGSYKGSQVSIRYFERETTTLRGKDQTPVRILTPHRITDFRSAELHLLAEEEFDKAVLFWIHNKHKNSPLAGPNSQAYYESYSKQAEARLENEQTDMFVEVFLKLKELSREQLLIKARGITIKGSRVAVGKDMSKDELVRAIANFAINHKRDFTEAFNSELTDFKGVVECATDMGLIFVTKVNGQDAWVFSQEAGGEVIAHTKGATDPKSVLFDEVNRRFMELYPKIEGLVSGRIEAVSEADIAAKMAARKTSSVNPELPAPGTIEGSIVDNFEALKESGLVKIEKAKVYVDGVEVAKIGQDYKKIVAEYIADNPQLLKQTA